MQNLNVALVQTNITWHQPKENRKQLDAKIKTLKNNVDLVILPEMFSTGFSMDPQNIAETMYGETISWMLNLAKIKNIAIAGSLIIVEDNKYYNRFVFVHPSGKLDYYNKRHLFSLAGEDKIYTAGAQKVIINYKNWKICPQVCYDLRFPVFSRNIENYDLLIYVANWPVPRIKAWDNLLKARAIENMSYVLGVNRIGEDANHLQYNGHSVALNYLGENIVNGYSEENIFEANLSKESMNEARKKLNFLSDKDNFKLL